MFILNNEIYTHFKTNWKNAKNFFFGGGGDEGSKVTNNTTIEETFPLLLP